MEHAQLKDLVKKMEDSELDDLLTTAQREYKARLDRLLAEAQDRADASELFRLTLIQGVPHRND